MEGCFMFQWGARDGGRGVFLRCGGFIFKWGLHMPHGGIGFDGGGFEKNQDGGIPTCPPMGN